MSSYSRSPSVKKVNIILIEVTDPLRGGLSALGFAPGMEFIAREMKPGRFRVYDGQRDFSFTQQELDEGGWIKHIRNIT